MKIAIIVGISQYHYLDNLPGCAQDVAAMNDLLQASKVFDRIEWLKETESANFKPALNALITSLKGQQIDELLFYFSGHGLFHDEDVYYALTDSDTKTIRQTAIQNSELDEQLKALSPGLVIKMIDACQSGANYIKGKDEFEKHYQGTKGRFNRCYFMHSSMNNQSSWGTLELSYFTESLLSAVATSNRSSVRYKDLIDYISDEFESNTRQKPHFVTQGDFTDVFIPITAEVKMAIGQYLKVTATTFQPAKSEAPNTKENLLELVKKEAALYATESELLDMLSKTKTELEKESLPEELSTLYVKKVKTADLSEMPKKIAIGRWLQQNTHDYFAEPTFRSESYEEEVATPAWSLTQILSPKKTVIRQRKILEGYELTAEVPFKCIYINFLPEFPNLPHYTGIIAFLFSPKEIRFFTALTTYKNKNWKMKEIVSEFDWDTETYALKASDFAVSFSHKLFDDFTRFVLEAIRKKFNIAKE